MQNSKENSGRGGEERKRSNGVDKTSNLQDLMAAFETYTKMIKAANGNDGGHAHSNNNDSGEANASSFNNDNASFSKNCNASTTSNGFNQVYANSTNNGYVQGYVSTTSNDPNQIYANPTNNGCVQGYTNSINNVFNQANRQWHVKNVTGNAFAINNGHGYPYCNGYVINPQNKVYLPFVDSSIVSMVPPPSFIKGTGIFATPTVASVAQTSSWSNTFSTPPSYSLMKPYRKRKDPRVVTSTSVKKSASEVAIMHYAKNDDLFKQFVSEEKLTMICILQHSRLLKRIIRNNFKYLSPYLPESIEEEVSVVVKDKNISLCDSMEEEVSEKEVSDKVEDVKLILAFMEGAKEAFQSLPVKLCEFYRLSSIAKIKKHLDEDWKFNLSCECCHERPMHFAVRSRYDLLDILSSVAKIDLPNKYGETALHVACETNSLDVVAYLIYHGADPLKKNVKGETCLYVCQRLKNIKMAKIILEMMDIDSINEFLEDHMVLAVREGATDFVELFLRFKANIDYLDKEGNSAISLAVQLGYKDILALLLEAKANIEKTYMTEGNSLLHIACKHDKKDSVKELLEAGASVRAVNCFRETPLHLAAQYSSIDIIRMLLIANADINAKDGSMYTPLYWAIIQNKVMIAKYLLSNGATTKSIVAPFILAIMNQHHSMVKLLVSYGLHTDDQGEIRKPLSDAAIKYGTVDLINLCSDVNSTRNL